MARAISSRRLTIVPVLALVFLVVLAVCGGTALADPGAVTGLASPTHPDDSAWYSSANPSFSWSPSTATDSAIAGYSFVLDRDPLTVPDAASVDRVSLSFLPRVPITVGSSPTEDRVADLNGDGKLDIVLENSGSSTISILIGHGDGTFEPRADYATGTQPWSIDIGDLNGDGKLDVVTCNLAASSASVLINNGDGTFRAKVDYTTGAGSLPECLRLGDVNGDGKLDVLTANAGTNNVGVLLGNGDGSFGAPATFSTATHPTSIDMGDLNNDGTLDLVTANFNTNNVSVLMGNGDGTFQTAVNYACGSQPETVAVADLNRDGRPDVVTVNYSPACASILLNNGDGTLAPKVDYVTGDGPYSLDVLDLNHDTAPDLVTVNHAASTVSILFGNGDGTFNPKTDLATGSGPFWVALGDLTGDGYGDLVTTDQGDGTISVYAGTTFLAASFTGKADGEWYFHVRAVDANGVGGTPATRTVRIDATKPTTTADGLQTSATSGWQTTGQLVTLSGADTGGSALAATYYSLDGGPQQAYTEPFTVSGSASHTVVYWSVDGAGNVESTQTGFVNIDTDAPATTADGLQTGPSIGWQNHSQLVTLSAGDGAGSGVVATSYKVDGGDWQPYTGAFAVSGSASHTVSYLSTDSLGNAETPQTGYVNIDMDVPATTADGLQSGPTIGWQSHSQLVTLTGGDGSGSGVAATSYTIDGRDAQTYSEPFIVSGQASHEITYWSTDMLGNAEAVRTGYVNIDETAPTLTADAPSGWSAAPVTVQLHPADAGGSGVAATRYRLSGASDWTIATGDAFSVPAPSDGSNDGAHLYDVQALDAAGNVSETGSCTVSIDASAPTTTADGLAGNDHSSWRTTSQVVTLNGSDSGGSGLAGTYYSLDGGDQQTYTTAFTVSGFASHTVVYWSVDALGNTEGAHTGYVNIGVSLRQTTASGLQLSALMGWQNQPQQVTLNASGGSGSGLAATYYKLDGGDTQTYVGPFIVSGEASHTVAYWSTDEVGDPEAEHTGYVNIDATAPTVSDDCAGSWVASPVTVTLHPADAGGGGVGSTQYRLHGTTAWTATDDDAFSVPAPSDGSNDGAHLYDYQALDGAGNVSATGSCTVRIDTTAPTVTCDADAYWHNSAVTVHLAADDLGAGMVGGSSSLAYRLTSDNGSPVTQAWTQIAATGGAVTVAAPADGQAHTYVFASQASDALGKLASGQFTVRMDARRPATSISGLPASSWTNRPVALVFVAAPGDGASIARTEYSLNGGASWTSLVPTAAGTLTLSIAAPGVHTVLYRSVSSAGTIEDPARSATVQIDTGKPLCFALKNLKVKARKTAKLPFRIRDAAPSCGSAKVTITIYRSKKVGKKTVLKVSRRITIASAMSNKNLRCTCKLRLKKGSYKWRVTATDAAGNVGTMSKLKKLTVK